jgi:hypothetical protein
MATITETKEKQEVMLCINQIIRPRGDWERLPDWGFCQICIPSPENVYCAGFKPIIIKATPKE